MPVFRIKHQFFRFARPVVQVLREVIGEHLVGRAVNEQQALGRQPPDGLGAIRLARDGGDPRDRIAYRPGTDDYRTTEGPAQ